MSPTVLKSKDGNDRINSLQILKGIAALMVVLYHIRSYLMIIGNNNNTCFKVFTEVFSYGALLFFTISGFLMAYLINKSYENFFVRRILRIYPTYIIIAIIAVVLKTLTLNNYNLSLLQMLKSLSLFPFGNIPYPLNVEWTLIYEVFFYFICSLFFIKKFKKFFPYFLTIWLYVIVASSLFYHIPSDFLPTYNTIFTSLYNGYFIFGCFAYYIYRKVHFNHKFTYYIIGTICIASTVWLEYLSKSNAFISLTKSFAFMICFSLILYSVLKLESDRKSKAKDFLIKFGDYSYALYLIHVPIITIIFSTLYIKYGIPLNSLIAFIALIVVLVCGWYLGKMDLLIQNYIKSKTQNVSKITNKAATILVVLVVCFISYETIYNVRFTIIQRAMYTGPPVGYLDTPSVNAVVSGTHYKGDGWFLDNKGIVKIEVFLDNTFLCDISETYPRPAIQSVYPGFKEYSKAGFIFYFDTTRFQNGNHVILIKETNKSGEIHNLNPVNIIIKNGN